MDTQSPGISSLFLTMDAAQCAELLYCSKIQVERLAERGELPGMKVGRGWVFGTAQIIEHLRVTSEAEAADRRALMVPGRLTTAIQLALPRPRGRQARPLPTFATKAA